MIDTLEILAGVIEAAKGNGGSMAIGIDTSIAKHLPIESFINATTVAVDQIESKVALLVFCEPEQKEVAHIIEIGAPAIAFQNNKHSRQFLTDLYQWSVESAGHHKIEIFAHFEGLVTENRLFEFVQQTGVSGIILPVGLLDQNKHVISYSYVTQLAKIAHIPLIAEEFPFTDSERQHLAKANLDGVIVMEELHEAFIAGLHTGLRNRSVTNPYSYNRFGIRSVSGIAEHYL
jgi:hypothetical protein